MSHDDEGAKLLTRKTVYDGRVVKLDLERVALPGGHVAELELVRHPGAACIVPFVTADEILLLRQYRHAAGGYVLEVPAGCLEPGEAPEDCARRELQEETGWTPGRLERLGTILTSPGVSNERIHVFAAHELKAGESRTEDCEVISVMRVGFPEALAKIASGEIEDAKTICALSLAREKGTVPYAGPG